MRAVLLARLSPPLKPIRADKKASQLSDSTIGNRLSD